MTQLTIGHLAERAGVATSAIRFYESKGLISSVRTTGSTAAAWLSVNGNGAPCAGH